MTEQTVTAADIDELFQPNLSRVPICFDSELVVEIERLEEQLEQALLADERTNRTPQAPAIAESIIELRESERAKRATVEFVFHGIGKGPYRALRDQHPPTDAQVADAEDKGARRPDWNPDTFYPALCAKACLSPTGTDESWWARKFEQWEDGRVFLVQNAARIAQEAYMELPKAELAYELTGTSRPKRK